MAKELVAMFKTETHSGVRHLISGVDHPGRLVCCPLLHAIFSTDPITRPHVMSDEHNLLPCISGVRDALGL